MVSVNRSVKMKKTLSTIFVAAVVLALAGVASANGITNGAWEDPASWWDGVVPDPNSTELVYVGPAGTTGANHVTITSDLPQIMNQLYFSDMNFDITGTLNVENAWNWAGAYGPTVINVNSDTYFRVGPDTFALDGRNYICHINVSGNGFMETYWPHFYPGAAGNLQINLSNDATWKTWGMWFQDSSTIYPTPGAAYNIHLTGNAQFMVGNLTGHPNGWSEADALDAIADGFITGAGLTVSTSDDTFYTVVSAPGKVAVDPDPADGDTYVAVDSVLSWAPGTNVVAPVTYDVYFDTNPSPTTLVSAAQSGTTFDPFGASDMANDTTYFWRIDTHDAAGTHTGDVWSFTTTPAPATLAWYKFNGNANDEIDILNNGVDGFIPSVYSTGIDSQAVTFNADDPDQHIEVANTIADGLRQASISFWINPQGDTTPPGIIMGTDDLPSGSALLMSEGLLGEDDKMDITFSVIGNSPQELNVGADPNAWNHVAVTYDAIDMKCRMYLNGLLDAEYDYVAAGDLVIGPMNIGAWYSGGGGYQGALLGSVDDLRIFNYLLSDLNVASLYTNFVPGDICLDLSGDCDQDLEDFAIFAQGWQIDTDIEDLAEFMLIWLDCTSVPTCNFELP
jgi:hypothetical protein